MNEYFSFFSVALLRCKCLWAKLVTFHQITNSKLIQKLYLIKLIRFILHTSSAIIKDSKWESILIYYLQHNLFTFCLIPASIASKQTFGQALFLESNNKVSSSAVSLRILLSKHLRTTFSSRDKFERESVARCQIEIWFLRPENIERVTKTVWNILLVFRDVWIIWQI